MLEVPRELRYPESDLRGEAALLKGRLSKVRDKHMCQRRPKQVLVIGEEVGLINNVNILPTEFL